MSWRGPGKGAVLLCLVVPLSLWAAIAPAAGAPMEPDFADCNTKPVWTIPNPGNLNPNCCKLEALLHKQGPVYKTWQQYLEQNPLPERPRVRRAAHLVADNLTYIAQLDLAFRRIKALPDSDPRSHFQQMNFHCIYGTGVVVHQAGRPDLPYTTHGNWLFFPFHRWYTFFYERILAKLVGDEDFALPFWNWDNQTPDERHPPNTIPLYFRDPDRYPGLYHKYRDGRHEPGAPPAVVDLDKESVRAGRDAVTAKDIAITRANNNAHLRDIIAGNGDRETFLSHPMRAGQGTLGFAAWDDTFESKAHIAVHFWIGDRQQYFADMGVTYHAVRDPLFFPHHANVDRLWNVWQGLQGKVGYDDPDYLDSAFYFYDEHGELVKVTVADCLDSDKLKYIHEDVENPWITYDPAADAHLFFTTSTAHSQA